MLNSLNFQGRLTADPELKKTSNDISYLEVTVAWSEKYKDNETKCFMRCKAWRGTAELIAKHWSKGKEIVIEGRMVTETWDKDGQQQSRTICDVQKVHFSGSAKSDNSAPPQSVEGFEPLSDDDIPF